MIKNVYTVSQGEVVKIPVKRETSKMVFFERRPEMSNIAMLNKKFVCVTPGEAIQEERNKAVTMLVLANKRLEKAQLRFAQVVGLEEELNG